jgi:membrane-associated protease RseP (regulator of RpoE activity)
MMPAPGRIPLQSAPNRKEWIISLLLFLATLLTTTFAGLVYYASGDGETDGSILALLLHPSSLTPGLLFSIPFLSIFLAHELGHFFACRYYAIRCTPPFFIPLPLNMAGTLGAFIRIRSPFPNKRALFDVGVAGPLAGFVVILPVLFFGIAHSRLVPITMVPQGINFGEPLIFRWIGTLMLGYSPAKQVMIAHPAAMAAWFGLLATSLNLFPIWQLDGGHITYALFGRTLQKKMSVMASIALVFISFLGWPIPSYLVFALLILILGWRYRLFHPPTLSDEIALTRGRILLGYIAFVVFVVSFTPVPVSII